MKKVETIEQVQRIVDKLADVGLIVVFSYGPFEERFWSLDVTEPHGKLDETYRAETLPQAASIALQECTNRGWVK